MYEIVNGEIKKTRVIESNFNHEEGVKELDRVASKIERLERSIPLDQQELTDTIALRDELTPLVESLEPSDPVSNSK